MSGRIPLYVFGAGGHGHAVADDATHGSTYEVRGFLDSNPKRSDTGWPEWPLVGGLGAVDGIDPKAEIALAIGDNQARHEIADALRSMGRRLATIIHPTAVVSRRARIGDGGYVAPFANIQVGSEIGDGCIIGVNAVISHDVEVGCWVQISPHAVLGGAARVGDGVHVGLGGIVLPSVTIGAWSRLGAGAVAIRSIPENVTAVGVPARVLTPVENTK